MKHKEIEKIMLNHSIDSLEKIVCEYFNLDTLFETKHKLAKVCYIILITHVKNVFKPTIKHWEIAEKLGCNRSYIPILIKDFEMNKQAYLIHLKELITKIYF